MEIKELKDLLASADAVLIGAGAGMSVPAGIDLMDKEAFAKAYPAMLQYGFTYGYQLMGYPYEDDALRWGYLSASLNDMFNLGIDDTYQKLLQLVSDKEYFVITSNVDRLFHKNGFDEERIYTPQGDSALFQCKIPCHHGVWDAKPLVAEMVKHIDPKTQYLTDRSLIPTCPVCGGKVYMNVRSGSFYLEEHHDEGRKKLNEWLSKNLAKKIVLLEIGVGFNTPGVIRYPFEKMLKQLPDATLVRLNPGETRVPPNGHSVKMGVEEALSQLVSR